MLFDSGHGGQIPFEGVISEGPAVRIQFITDQPNHNTGFNIRYEGTHDAVKGKESEAVSASVIHCQNDLGSLL